MSSEALGQMVFERLEGLAGRGPEREVLHQFADLGVGIHQDYLALLRLHV